MNHDIAHCNNEDCTAKNDCRRYKAHLEAVKVGMPYVPYLYYKELKNSGNDDCEMYWKEVYENKL